LIVSLFSAQNDDWDYSWTARTGIPLARFEERWNRLSKVTYSPEPGESHPFCDPDPRNLAFDSSTAGPSLTGRIPQLPISLDASIRLRAAEMARLLLQSCPGDWTQGMNVAFAGQLRHFINDGKSVEWGLDTAEVLSIVQFRWDMGLLADHIVNRFGLPKPGNTGCMWWDRMQGRQRALHHKDLHKKVWDVLVNGGLFIMPTREQGPPFSRFVSYLTAAIIDADKSHDDTMALTHQIVQYFNCAKISVQDRVNQTPRVRALGQSWLKTIGRRVRRSLSPTKRRSGSVDEPSRPISSISMALSSIPPSLTLTPRKSSEF
jgi:hypothetical protein